jgi:hypothetical protein
MYLLVEEQENSQEAWHVALYCECLVHVLPEA